jgi:hypothetical protein
MTMNSRRLNTDRHATLREVTPMRFGNDTTH